MLSYLPFIILPVISTFAGGCVVYFWKKDLHPWLSLSGGVLLGVAFLDLLPEAVERGAEAGTDASVVFGVTLAAVIIFHLFDLLLGMHGHHEHAHKEPPEACENRRHRETAGWIRAGSMVAHSFFDGVAIGGGFATDYRLGLLVTAAVVMHDFSDGMSTVTVLRHARGEKKRGILPLLAADAVAPFIGALAGIKIAPTKFSLAIMLASFAGFFLFLSLSELLPQAHRGQMSRRFGFALTLTGVLAVAFITRTAEV